MFKVDLWIEFNKDKTIELFNYLSDPINNYEASQISLDLRDHNYIVFDSDYFHYDDDEQDRVNKLANLFTKLVEKEFVSKEAVQNCIKNEECWISDADDDNVSLDYQALAQAVEAIQEVGGQK